jgi:hypothetical protein
MLLHISDKVMFPCWQQNHFLEPFILIDCCLKPWSVKHFHGKSVQLVVPSESRSPSQAVSSFRNSVQPKKSAVDRPHWDDRFGMVEAS